MPHAFNAGGVFGDERWRRTKAVQAAGERFMRSQVRQSVRGITPHQRLPSALLFIAAHRRPSLVLSAHAPMTVALQATTPATFEIKSANLPLVALLLKSTDLVALARELEARFGDIPDFFDQDALMIDLSPLPDAAGEVDFPALISLLGSYQLVPICAKGGSAARMAAALQAGLLPVPDAHLVAARPAVAAAPPAASPVAAPVPTEPLGALVIDKPLRSGQQVYARGRDLVVLAMVNAGAEVIADGHIHVYAPLRGKAMAGARGNTGARIFSLALEAELLSIAGVYRTSEHPLPPGMAGKPTQVRLVPGDEGDKLVMNIMSA
jgi:septum site-determining protein MinC